MYPPFLAFSYLTDSMTDSFARFVGQISTSANQSASDYHNHNHNHFASLADRLL
jgi:hypothetical protein